MTSSIDSNLLVYAHNVSAPEHRTASRFIEGLLKDQTGEQVVLIHQTLFEFYSILTNPLIVAKPNPAEAWKICLYYFRHASIQMASYESPVLQIIQELMKESPGRGKRFFDLVLAATLKYHGVRRFYTRNEKHFREYGFLEIISPL